MKTSTSEPAGSEDGSTGISETTSDCSERLEDDREPTANDRATTGDCRKSTENGEWIVDQENGFDKYRSRESSSEYSLSSDSSLKSLDELQEDILGIDFLDNHMSENMDFVFNNDSNVGMSKNGDVLNWQTL